LEIRLKPIGTVHNEVPFGQRPPDWKKVLSTLQINEDFEGGLSGIEDFSHLYVLFWMSPEEMRLHVHPRGRDDLPLLGVFATRSPTRPNPIGLSLVQLIKREGRGLQVLGLDAYDGTPILDIKPYLLKSPPEATFPTWASHLDP